MDGYPSTGQASLSKAGGRAFRGDGRRRLGIFTEWLVETGPERRTMASIFTQIMAGQLPGRFVWQDSAAVALLSNRPIKPGHVLVVPRQEVDHWIDLSPELNEHLFRVAQTVARGIQQAFSPAKVGMAVVGLEVRHVHIHLVPIDAVGDLDFARQDPNPSSQALDQAAERLRASLRALGYGDAVAPES